MSARNQYQTEDPNQGFYDYLAGRAAETKAKEQIKRAAIEAAGGWPAIEAALVSAGASEHAVRRCKLNTVFVDELPPAAHDWRSTPANTSNIDVDVVQVNPRVAWKKVRGWTGADSTPVDELFILR